MSTHSAEMDALWSAEDLGWEWMNVDARSPLAHPLGLPLLCLFHPNGQCWRKAEQNDDKDFKEAKAVPSLGVYGRVVDTFVQSFEQLAPLVPDAMLENLSSDFPKDRKELVDKIYNVFLHDYNCNDSSDRCPISVHSHLVLEGVPADLVITEKVVVVNTEAPQRSQNQHSPIQIVEARRSGLGSPYQESPPQKATPKRRKINAISVHGSPSQVPMPPPKKAQQQSQNRKPSANRAASNRGGNDTTCAQESPTNDQSSPPNIRVSKRLAERAARHYRGTNIPSKIAVHQSAPKVASNQSAGVQTRANTQAVKAHKVCEQPQSTSHERRFTADESIPGKPILIVEFGQDNAFFWAKFKQGLHYVALSQARHALLAVVTYHNGNGGNVVSGKAAIFFCWIEKRNERDEGAWKKCSLWRDVFDDLSTMASILVKFYDTARHLAVWQKLNHSANYKYLGPNCCCIGSDAETTLVRCYDTRVLECSCSPKLYLDKNLWKDEQRATTKYLHCPDKNAANVPNKAAPEDSKSDRIWHLWGQILVLACPYVEGSHLAKSPAHFIGGVNDLANLHEMGYVHGDIRLFNMVFMKTTAADRVYDSRLIDYDYGGKQKSGLTYPKGFKPVYDVLSRRHAGQDVLCIDDWRALWSVITDIHFIQWPDGVTTSENDLLQKEIDQNMNQGNFTYQDAPMLVTYLEGITEEGWTFSLKSEKRDLIGADNATGSPENMVVCSTD